MNRQDNLYGTLFLIVIGIVLVVVGFFVMRAIADNTNTVNDNSGTTANGTTTGTDDTMEDDEQDNTNGNANDDDTTGNEDTQNEYTSSKGAVLMLTQPDPSLDVTCPILISGTIEADGWFFEGQFPIYLEDLQGDQVAQAIATAQGNWMTTDPINFTATLNCNANVIENYTLVFDAANPSDLAENADTIEVEI